MKTSASSLVVSLMGMVALAWGCAPAIALEDRPCPCGDGWTCCPTQNVCVAPGQACPAGGSGLGQLGGDAGFDPETGLGGLSDTTNPIELASAQSARCMATDTDHVYWQNADGLVVGSAKRGGNVQISSMRTPLADSPLCGIAIVGEELFTTSYGLGKLVKLSLASNGEWAIGGNLTLFGNVTTPSSIAVDADAVYVTEHEAGRIARVPLTRAVQSVIAEGLVRPHGLIALGEDIYFVERGDGATPGAIKRVAKTGGPITTLAGAQASPHDLVAWDGTLYWTAGSDLFSMPMSGGTPKKLVSGTAFGPLDIFGNEVVFSGFSKVLSVPLTGGTASELFDGPAPALAVDEARVFWFNGSSVFSGKKSRAL